MAQFLCAHKEYELLYKVFSMMEPEEYCGDTGYTTLAGLHMHILGIPGYIKGSNDSLHYHLPNALHEASSGHLLSLGKSIEQ